MHDHKANRACLSKLDGHGTRTAVCLNNNALLVCNVEFMHIFFYVIQSVMHNCFRTLIPKHKQLVILCNTYACIILAAYFLVWRIALIRQNFYYFHIVIIFWRLIRSPTCCFIRSYPILSKTYMIKHHYSCSLLLAKFTAWYCTGMLQKTIHLFFKAVLLVGNF